MPGSESSISTGGTGTQQAIPASEDENLIDGGPLDMGRLDVDIYGNEGSIATGGTGTEGSISAQ